MIIRQPYELLTVAVTNLTFFPKKVNISCPKQTIEQSQFSCHKIPHYTSVLKCVNMSLKIKNQTKQYFVPNAFC